MKTGFVEYMTPTAVPVEISSEGILCESYGNESYESNENYGNTDEPNKGWY